MNNDDNFFYSEGEITANVPHPADMKGNMDVQSGSNAMKGADNMPLGLGMALGMNSYANGYWNTLDTAQKGKVTKYIQNCATGNEAHEKVDKAIYALEHHNLDMLK